MTGRSGLVLLLFLAGSAVAAGLGSMATASSVNTWYTELAKPNWNPPNWLFAPVWTALYTAMAVAAWRVWRKRSIPGTATVIRVYWFHLLLNTAWSFLFFGLRQPGAGLVGIVVLWGAIFWLLGQFWQRDRLAGVLWAPYLAWVTFATALNFEIWRLN